MTPNNPVDDSLPTAPVDGQLDSDRVKSVTHPEPGTSQPAKPPFVLMVILVVLVLALIAGAIMAVRTVQTNQRVDDAKDRFIAAIIDLDSDNPLTRGDAIAQLFAVADVWSDMGATYSGERDKCIQAVQKYVRKPIAQGSDGQADPTELWVRREISQLLRAHLIDGGTRSWADYSFDFSGGTFVDADFSGAALESATFSNASFLGETRFNGASLGTSSDREPDALPVFSADFRGATFAGGVDFGAARLSNADFSHAVFSGSADFEYTSFSCAEYMICEIDFSGASFGSDAQFSGAEFDDLTYFNQATFAIEPVFGSIPVTVDVPTAIPATVFLGSREGKDPVVVTGATAIVDGKTCPLIISDGIPIAGC